MHSTNTSHHCVIHLCSQKNHNCVCLSQIKALVLFNVVSTLGQGSSRLEILKLAVKYLNVIR